MVVSLIAKILGAFTSLYMILCAVRVFMSWVPNFELGKAGRLIAVIVDPYLAFFSRVRFLRSDRFDFSPIAALAILSVANNMFSTIALTGRISFGFLLSLILGALWSAFAFVFSFLAACALLRILVFIAKWNSLHPVWVVLDSILNPVLYRINKIIYRNRAIDYLQGLITGFLVLVLFRALGGAAVRLLSSLLIALPF
ncbi:MAG: YggT family protein [Spirochaetes bacterium]|nr:YggT family protein [Spirochaetota bacterium]